MSPEVKKYLSDESEKLYKDKISECQSHITKQAVRIKHLEAERKDLAKALEAIKKLTSD